MQIVIGLPDGSGYQLTTARYFTPSGHVIQGNGIAPDVEVALADGDASAALSGMIVSGEVDWRESDAQLCAAWQAAADMVEAGWTLPDSRTDGSAATAAEPEGAAFADVRTPERMSDCV